MYLDRLKLSLCFFIGIVIVGIIGFMSLEELSFYDAAYFTIVTIATVGFGDIVPKTPAGRIFTCLFIIIGVGMAYYTFT